MLNRLLATILVWLVKSEFGKELVADAIKRNYDLEPYRLRRSNSRKDTNR